jgi:uncharacterized protein involved in exopolysaccharide biosynthesis/Mrp family chromosome partitioning ATPase
MNYFGKISPLSGHQGAPPPPVQLREDELDGLAFIRLVRRRIRLIAFITILISVAALPFILAIERYYYGQTRVLIQSPLPKQMSLQDSLAQLNLSTEVERLTSQGIATMVIEKLHLDTLEEFNPDLRDPSILEQLKSRVREWVGLKAEKEKEEPSPNSTDPVVLNFLAALSVVRPADVVEIGFTSTDPELAGTVPNEVVKTYLEARQENMRTQYARAKEWVEQRIDLQRQRVERARLAAVGYVPAGLKDDIDRSIVNLSNRRADLVTRRSGLEATVARLEASGSDADKLGLIDSQALDGLRYDLQLQERELARMLDIYKSNYAAVGGVRKQINEIKAAIAREIDRNIESMRAQAAALDKEEASIQSDLAAARAELSKLEQAEVEAGELRRVADQEQSALDELSGQLEILDKQMELPAAVVEVLSPASIPLWPEGRGKAFYLVVAVVAALGVALTVACILEVLDSGVRSHQQLEGTPGLLPAAMIPRIKKRRARRLPDLKWRQPGYMFAEAMRGLAQALEFTSDGRNLGSIALTSAFPGEGKSLVASALALELSATGHRVLLVDADLRRGRIHTVFGGKMEPGLAEFASGHAELADIIRTNESSGLSYIVRGNSAKHPSHFDEKRALQLLRVAKEQGYTVVFDTAPILAAAETSMLARLADRTVLIIHWGKTHRRAVDMAVQRLAACIGDDALVALNMVNPRRHALYGFRDASLYASEVRRYYARVA